MTFADFLQRFHCETLDEQQRAAVEATEGPVLLLAVPGSGKTTTLLARLGYLIYGRGVPPSQILTCTYTVSATNEMRDRFRAKFGTEYADQLEFRTINGICARIISLYARQGHDAFELIADESRRYAVLREAWIRYRHTFPSDSDLRSMGTAITYVKNQMMSDTEADGVVFASSDGGVPIGPVYRFYRHAMRRKRWMDYDDQMVYARAILNKNPPILQSLQRRYRYFCVDEAQDTSRIQHEILAMLAADSRNLMMVGDEDQSIYGFRAAYPQALMDFEKNWPGARVLLMERNYRSTPQIVHAADQFIRQNKMRREKRMRAARIDGSQIQILSCTSRTHQYELLAQFAAEAAKNGRQVAILYRNNDTALPVIDLLSRQNIPYQTKGTDGLFFTSKTVEDIRTLLYLARHPDDKEAFLNIYYKIGIYMKKDVAKFPVESAGKNIFDAYLALEETQISTHLRHVLREKKNHLAQIAKRNDPSYALQTIAGPLGYREYLVQKGIDPFRLDILSALAEKERTIDSFLARLGQLQQIVKAGSGSQTAGCILSTIHSSKGLEYDSVFLADMVVGTLPAQPPATVSDAERLRMEEEERRLFYVALTRAKNKLTIMAVDRMASPYVRTLQTLLGRPSGKSQQKAHPHKKAVAVDLTPYAPGVHVKHRSFGSGVILSRSNEYATIDFGANGTRTLALPFAIQMSLLHRDGA